MAQKCVHQGCAKLYTDEEEECHYHPGPPIFHEGQKGWKCCKPRVLTFDEFLSIPPCTIGKHSTTDLPPTIEKKQGGDVSDSSKPILEPVYSTPEASRAPISAPQPTATPPPPPPESEDDDPKLEIPKGKICRRRACNESYTGSREGEKCVYHPGAPLFHEGSKGYTCCKRRVLEFDEFMKIEGCKTKDRHLFVGSGDKKANNSGGEELLETVRHDFYQTPISAIASFFLKKINKDKAVVKFSEKALTLDLVTTDALPKRYKTVIPLFGPINTTTSTFKIMGTKLEVNLAKADGTSWPVLRSDEPVHEIIQIGKAGRA